MTLLRLASLILAVTLSLRGLAPGDDLLVGLLRSDGIVLPFARFANGAWSPAALDSSRAPTSDEMPRRWYLYAGDSGGLGRPLMGGSTVLFNSSS